MSGISEEESTYSFLLKDIRTEEDKDGRNRYVPMSIIHSPLVLLDYTKERNSS